MKKKIAHFFCISSNGEEKGDAKDTYEDEDEDEDGDEDCFDLFLVAILLI